MDTEQLTPEVIKQINDDIEMIPILSSNLTAIGYSEQYGVLKVIFKSKASYLYFNVEPEIFDKLKLSESKGKTLNESVVKHKEKYKYLKI